MVKHRSHGALGVLTLLAGGSVGCHNAALCEPGPAPLGQLVASGVSETYLARVDETGTDVPHIACKAETAIITTKAYLNESEDGDCVSTGKYCLGGSVFDRRMMAPLTNTLVDTTLSESQSAYQIVRGEFRIVGVGKGLAIQDCSETALRACNAGVDAYYSQQRVPRPPTMACRMADYQSMCEPGERRPRAPVVAAPEPLPSPEEQLPATWIARLGNAKKRAVAIRALTHFYTDALMRSHHDADNPAVKGVLDQIVEPLAKVYVEGNLERSTRVLLIRFLAETRDPRAARAYIHACHAFATAAGADEEDAHHAAAAIGATKLEEAAPALGEAFAKVRTGTPGGDVAAKSIRLAMLQLKSASWKPLLLEKLGAPMDPPPRSADAEQLARHQAQLFWQQTSAELLGAVGDASATLPLLKVLMEKDKAEIAGPALLGIVKLGKSSVPVLIDVLAGRDPQMVEFAKTKAAEVGGNAKLYVAASALALGAIGRSEARAPMIQALKASDNEMNRAVIARELTALSANAEAVKAAQTAYDRVPGTARIWPAMVPARPALLTASARFYDPEIVPWLLAQAAKDKDEETTSAALMSAILVMKKAHVVKVKTAVDQIGGEREKRAFQAAAELLGTCAEDVDCYLSKLNEGETSDGFAGVKAAHMVGVLGGTRAGAELVKRLAEIRRAEVRTAAVLAVDHAVQTDAAPVADALQKLVEEPSRDVTASSVAEQVVYRLRAR